MPVVKKESIIDPRFYHSIKEGKNGLGPAPIKTKKGWLHLAHGVRNTAAGMRYVLYVFLCDLKDPSKQISAPGGHFMGPENDERVGDVSNVVFANGWVARPNGDVFIYYGSSDTRTHVATTTVDKLLDYVKTRRQMQSARNCAWISAANSSPKISAINPRDRAWLVTGLESRMNWSAEHCSARNINDSSGAMFRAPDTSGFCRRFLISPGLRWCASPARKPWQWRRPAAGGLFRSGQRLLPHPPCLPDHEKVP